MENLVKKIRAYKEFYFNGWDSIPTDFDTSKGSIEEILELNAAEIRDAATSDVDSFDGIEFLIRILTGYGRNNGMRNQSAFFGAQYEYYGLKNGEIVRTPFFAPDSRYFDQTGVNDCRCLDLKDNDALTGDVDKSAKKVAHSTTVFRRCFPEKSAKYDLKHGAENWWAEGTTKTGFDIFFKP
jgi:hypothetical protein